MSLTKEECLKAIETLKDKYVDYDVVDELVTLKRLIYEHFKEEKERVKHE